MASSHYHDDHRAQAVMQVSVVRDFQVRLAINGVHWWWPHVKNASKTDFLFSYLTLRVQNRGSSVRKFEVRMEKFKPNTSITCMKYT